MGARWDRTSFNGDKVTLKVHYYEGKIRPARDLYCDKMPTNAVEALP